jgi:acetyl esterase/lipase
MHPSCSTRVPFVPYPFRPRRWRIANLSYGDAGKRNRLDVYRHGSHPQEAPTLLYFHGGGYISGNKSREGRASCTDWPVTAGYASAPRTGCDPQSGSPTIWSTRRKQSLGFAVTDTNTAPTRRPSWWGKLGGAHLATLAALTPNDPGLQPGFKDADTTVDAAICLYGYYGRYYGAATTSSRRPHHWPTTPRRHLHSSWRTAIATPTCQSRVPGCW